MTKKSSKKAKSQRSREQALLQKVHLNAAGIDIGADAHWVAVPEDRASRHAYLAAGGTTAINSKIGFAWKESRNGRTRAGTKPMRSRISTPITPT